MNSVNSSTKQPMSFRNDTKGISSKEKLFKGVSNLLAFCIAKMYFLVKGHLIELGFLLYVTVVMYYWKSALKKKKQTYKKPPPLALYEIALDSHDKVCADLCMENIDKYNYDVNWPLFDTKLSLFHYACLSGNSTLIKFMLEKGADVDFFTDFGDSPLYLATYGHLRSSSDFHALTTMMTYGCDINQCNSVGFTCLHQAAGSGNLTLTKHLIANGADPHIPDCFGVLPHATAFFRGHQEVAAFLKNKMKFSRRRSA